MATIRGCLTIIQSGAGNDTVGEVREAIVDTTTPEEDVSAMGDCTRKFSAGASETSIELNGFANHWDGTDPAPDAGQQNFVVGNNVDVIIQPNGTGSGKPQLSFNMVVLGERQSGSVDNSWTRDISGRVNGAIDSTPQT